MTFYPLSRYVRDDITLEEFCDGFSKFMSYAVQDPANNLAELDKAIPGMLDSKIFSFDRPRSGLMFQNPELAASILTDPYLLQLLFAPRITPKKHEWATSMLSPMARHLMAQNQWDRVPLIYQRFGRELDVSRGTVSLSTPDFFIMSVLSYPLRIGPLIPGILSDLNSSHRHRHWKDAGDGTAATSSPQAVFSQILGSLWSAGSGCGGAGQSADCALPPNPFKAQINGCYAKVFGCYLNGFVPRRDVVGSSAFPPDFSVRFLEMVGELWLSPVFRSRPIGDRCFTLPLLQDAVYRVAEKQVDHQRAYSEQRRAQRGPPKGGGVLSTGQLFDGGAVPRSSCLCPEALALRRPLFCFLRECLDHFPLDFVCHLRVVLELWLYAVAPWTLPFKQRASDEMAAKERNREISRFWDQQRNGGAAHSSSIGSGLHALGQWLGLCAQPNAAGDAAEREFNELSPLIGSVNDDRHRSLSRNNTRFATAEQLLSFEVAALESVCSESGTAEWAQYIVEMLPFYSSLLQRLCRCLVPFDFGHPLKQLPAAKLLHLWSLPTVRAVVGAAERTLFHPQPSYHGDSYGAHSAQQFVINVIQSTTLQPIQQFERCPLALDGDANRNDADSAESRMLWNKCKKTMLRLQDKHRPLQLPQREDIETEREDQPPAPSPLPLSSGHKFVAAAASKIRGWLSSGGTATEGAEWLDPLGQRSYFGDPRDDVLVLHHMIGSLEALFGIGQQEQQQLLNQSIMYEPSHFAPRRGPPAECAVEEPASSERRSVWERPQGEWEWYWALKLHLLIYQLLVLNASDGVKAFYSKYLEWPHRSYGADIRAIGWYILLFVAYRFFWRWLFFLFSLAFAVQVAGSLVR